MVASTGKQMPRKLTDGPPVILFQIVPPFVSRTPPPSPQANPELAEIMAKRFRAPTGVGMLIVSHTAALTSMVLRIWPLPPFNPQT